jgi:hypothetical protein
LPPLTMRHAKKARKRLDTETSTSWDSVVRDYCYIKHVRATRNYIKNLMHLWSPEALLYHAEDYLYGRALFCVSVEATKRGRFYDYVAVRGGSLRAFYENAKKLPHLARFEVIGVLRVPREAVDRAMLSALEETRKLIREAEAIVREPVNDII